MTAPQEGGDDGRSRPSSWFCVASTAPVVGLMAILFPIAPFWFLVWFAAIFLALRFTPLGERWHRSQPSALLSGLVSHPAILRHPILTGSIVFAIPVVLVTAVMWEISDPPYLWNGGAVWVSSVFAYLVWTIAVELRAAGHRARWWRTWLVITVFFTVFVLVGGPARARWAYCAERLTDRAKAGEEITQADTGRLCWYDTTQREVDGETRLYTDTNEEPNGGEGLVYSPDGSIVESGGLKLLIKLSDGWYWFETGTPVKSFWFDA